MPAPPSPRKGKVAPFAGRSCPAASLRTQPWPARRGERPVPGDSGANRQSSSRTAEGNCEQNSSLTILERQRTGLCIQAAGRPRPSCRGGARQGLAPEAASVDWPPPARSMPPTPHPGNTRAWGRPGATSGPIARRAALAQQASTRALISPRAPQGGRQARFQAGHHTTQLEQRKVRVV